jgi:hypothetical protein
MSVAFRAALWLTALLVGAATKCLSLIGLYWSGPNLHDDGVSAGRDPEL